MVSPAVRFNDHTAENCHQRYCGGTWQRVFVEGGSPGGGGEGLMEGNMKSNRKQRHNAAQPTLEKQTDLNIYSAPTPLPCDP